MTSDGDDPPGPPGPVDPFDPADPFAGLTFDDRWVREADLFEPTAEMRAAQAAWDEQVREAEEREARAWRRRRARRRRNRAFLLSGLLLFGAAVAVADRGDPPPSTWTSSDVASPARLVAGGSPTQAPAASSTPLGAPADPDASGGEFAFIATQQDGTTPVTYDPCRPIEIVVNEREAPPGTRRIIERAVSRASEVTGLAIEISATPTDEPASDQRSVYQPDRYGDRWAPVLVAWSDAGEMASLAGDVAGVGGSVSVQSQGQPRTYVSGMIALDAPDVQRILDDDPDGTAVVEGIVLHELAHVLGLDHVDSTDELMYPRGQSGVTTYQQGDRTGLTRLGQGSCVPFL